MELLGLNFMVILTKNTNNVLTKRVSGYIMYTKYNVLKNKYNHIGGFQK
jgi:hypothetical protein